MDRRLVTAGAVLAAGAAVLMAPGPAQAAGPGYVALGDSYSSGTGTRSYLADGTSCQRSVYAYPSLLASSRGYALDLRACSGAQTSDVLTTQLSSLNGATSYVTVSAGGNDAGFSDVLTTCAKPSWLGNCGAAVSAARTVITSQLPGRLATLYAAIRARAPKARVVVVGYPRIFNGQDCNAFTWFSPTDEAQLNAAADLIDQVLAAAAGAAGIGFSGPVAAFRGHAVCDSTEWVNGLSNPVSESFHPNRAGHASGYAPLVAATLTGAPAPVTAQVVRRAEASAGSLTATARRHAAQDRGIRPETFLLPDLTTPEARAAAALAGVDLGSRASIDAADRAGDVGAERAPR